MGGWADGCVCVFASWCNVFCLSALCRQPWSFQEGTRRDTGKLERWNVGTLESRKVGNPVRACAFLESRRRTTRDARSLLLGWKRAEATCRTDAPKRRFVCAGCSINVSSVSSGLQWVSVGFSGLQCPNVAARALARNTCQHPPASASLRPGDRTIGAWRNKH